MKRLLLVLTVLSACLVQADELSEARAVMATVLAKLASNDEVSIVLNGVVTDNGASKAFKTSLVLENSVVGEKRFTMFEIIEFVEGAIVARIVADGTRMWTYDVATKTYRSSNYSTEAFAGQERDRLFRLMALRAKDHQTFLARLLSETYGSKAAEVALTWAPWRPNSTIGFAGASIVCASTQPFSNQLTYMIENVEGLGLVLTGADYYEESVISSRTRTTHWQLTVASYDVPAGTSFEFIAPPGSRAVAASEPGGG